MSYKKFVASLLVGFLSSTCLYASIANAAEPELYFYPKNKWTVNEITARGDQPVCSVSNQLNNGYVLEMTGTSDGIENINLDFRQSAFQKNLKYEVQYSIPGISRTIVASKATKESLIVSDLSGKEEFAKGLASAGVLDVQIRDNNFRVYLTGLKASMPKFDDCVSPPEVLAAVESETLIEAETTPPPQNEDDILSEMPVMETRVVEEAEIEKVTPFEPTPVEGVAALPPPAAAPAAIAATEDAAPTDPKKLRPAPKDKPRYTEILAERLKEENKNYQPEETVVPKAKPKHEPEQKMVDSVDESRAAPVPTAKPVAKTSSVTREDVANSPKPVYNVTRNEKPIEVDLTDNPTSNSAQNASEINPSSGQANNDVINSDFIDMRNKISSMERELIALREKNKMLDEELKISLQEAEKEKISVSSDNWNLERATMKFNESERQIQRLGRQLQTARAVCEQEKKELETMLFDPKLTDQSQLAKLASLEAELDEAESELYRVQRQYEERIKILEQQLKGP